MTFFDLISAPEEQRNEVWESDFLKIIPEQSLSLIYSDPKPGPDKWPYLWLSTDIDTKLDNDKAINIFKWLSERGIGAVINPNKKLPDYVFTYGMIWYFFESGTFINRAVNTKKTFDLELSKDFYYGYPSEIYIPKYVRKVVTEFLLNQGIYKPKWILLSKDQKNYDLCFSLESIKNPPPKEHQGILEALSWFFPNHFNLVLVSEKNLPSFIEIQ